MVNKPSFPTCLAMASVYTECQGHLMCDIWFAECKAQMGPSRSICTLIAFQRAARLLTSKQVLLGWSGLETVRAQANEEHEYLVDFGWDLKHVKITFLNLWTSVFISFSLLNSGLNCGVAHSMCVSFHRNIKDIDKIRPAFWLHWEFFVNLPITRKKRSSIEELLLSSE